MKCKVLLALIFLGCSSLYAEGSVENSSEKNRKTKSWQSQEHKLRKARKKSRFGKTPKSPLLLKSKALTKKQQRMQQESERIAVEKDVTARDKLIESRNAWYADSGNGSQARGARQSSNRNLLSEKPNQEFFFHVDIGPGWLFFKNTTGNLGGAPENLFTDNGSIPYKGLFAYNVTPLFEYQIGYRLSKWLRAALSYQYQSQVNIQTDNLKGVGANVLGGSITNPIAMFQSSFSMNAFSLKGYVDFPPSMFISKMAISPYFGVSVGLGVQSWTNNIANYQAVLAYPTIEPSYVNSPLFLKSKYSTGLVVGLDFGVSLQSIFQSHQFSLYGGCKLNYWGAAPDLGKLSDQSTTQMGLVRPIRTGSVYSLAPYIGLLWNIPHSKFLKWDQRADGRHVNTWKPFTVDSCFLQTLPSPFVQFTGGIGLLYFSKVSGTLTVTPSTANNTPYGVNFGRYSMSHNRTPLVENITGIKIKPWLSLALSNQHQSSLLIETKPKSNTLSDFPTFSWFKSNLNLISTAGKVYFEPQKTLIFKGLATNVFLAGALGVSWQSWTNMGLIQELQLDNAEYGRDHATSNFVPLRDKIIANPFAMVDVGVRIKSARPDLLFHTVIGCKYNYWGRVRSLGKFSQQFPHDRQGLQDPINMRQLYSFAPYLGVQWNFDVPKNYSPRSLYRRVGKDTRLMFVYPIKIKGYFSNTPFFAQMTTGVGFLYFNGVTGNLAGRPFANVMDVYGKAPVNQFSHYNKTPVYEYMLGSQIADNITAGFSYQYQGGVNVSTSTLPVTEAVSRGVFTAESLRFIAGLRIDALMGKLSFTSPWSFLWCRLLNTPYLSLGCGCAIQSWKNMAVQRLGLDLTTTNDLERACLQPLHQKVATRLAWGVDMGVQMIAAYEGAKFSSKIGFKYNHYGAVPSLGRLKDQRGTNIALLNPIRAKTLYSFAPYFGVTWNF